MSLAIALIEPQIPPNTGNIARLAAATGTSLHLVEPLGFDLDAPQAKRAGLGYWDQVDVWTHSNLDAFWEAISEKRCLYFSAHGRRSYLDAPYSPNSVLVFGSETRGMPERILKDRERVFRIPMVEGVRNINLATSVGVVTYEAVRQLGIDLQQTGKGVPGPISHPK
jgi:tRNA (cytidine/uridine-2'-O-)-methyltransferase